MHSLLAPLQIGVSFSYRGEAGFLTRIVGEFLLPPLYALWLYSFTQAPHSMSYRLFCWKPFVLLGEWSFALYCLHWPAFTYYRWFRFGHSHGWAAGNPAYTAADAQLQLFDFPLFFGMLIGLSALVFYRVEQPCRAGLYTRLGRVFGLRSTTAYGSLDDSTIESAIELSQLGELGVDGGGDAAAAVPAPVPVMAQLVPIDGSNGSIPVAVPVDTDPGTAEIPQAEAAVVQQGSQQYV
jgi:hypothetical protein